MVMPSESLSFLMIRCKIPARFGEHEIAISRIDDCEVVSVGNFLLIRGYSIYGKLSMKSLIELDSDHEQQVVMNF